jgi:ferrous iron transport protein B
MTNEGTPVAAAGNIASARELSRERPTVVVCGNPNSGKTTLFNGLTGSTQRVGNWPGVTVEKKEGTMMVEAPSLAMVTGRAHPERHSAATAIADVGDGYLHDRIQVVDLPGIYSFSATSEDEVVARDVLLEGRYDLVVNIVDAANLERNLYLTLQLIEMKVPLLVVLNMLDLAENRGIQVDTDALARRLRCPVVAVTSTTRAGIVAARHAISGTLHDSRVSDASVRYPDELESVVDQWSERPARSGTVGPIDSRYAAIRLIEGDPWMENLAHRVGWIPREEQIAVRQELETVLEQELDIVVADARYRFIQEISDEVVRRRATRESVTEQIDRVVMSRVLGLPIFFIVMYLVFWATVAVGGAFIDFFEIGVGTILVDGVGAALNALGAPQWVTIIMADGIGTGVQTVATFIPIIFMMFFMLSLLEDSGYMARAAFVMDRVMRWAGLPGKSFVPLLVGFGCTVPAISATRTLESRRDRFTTIFMAPFMSCGARLPVYALFAAALFPARAGLTVFSLYVTGMVLAILTGLLLKHTIFHGEYSHFVMELPPYHAPRLVSVILLAGRRLRVFVVRAGITITVVVTILAVLNSFGTDGSFGNEDSDRSVLAGIGRGITPVFGPMGIEADNWPATVGLFTGMFAKEAIVGTLSALYSQGDQERFSGSDEWEEFDLAEGLRQAVATVPENLRELVGAFRDPLGLSLLGEEESTQVDRTIFGRMRSRFSPAAGYAYLLFVLIYFPCIAALGIAIQEMGRGYGWLLAVYLTVLAWAMAVLYYQFATGPSLLPVMVALGLLAGVYFLFRVIARHTGLEKPSVGALH